MALSNERKLELFNHMLEWIWNATGDTFDEFEYGLALEKIGMTKQEIMEELRKCCIEEKEINDIINELEEVYDYWREDDLYFFSKHNKYGNVYVTTCEDCGDNIGGLFCQVYTDEYFDEELDFFCIHPDECDCKNTDAIRKFILERVGTNYNEK